MRSFVAGLLFLGAMGSGAAAEAPQRTFLSADGGKALVHVESGTKLPAKLAGFTRIGERKFDGGGEYVGVAYKRDLPGAGAVVLTIAIVHIQDMTAAQHFIIAKPMVLKGLTDVTTLSEGAYDRPGKGMDGYQGLYNARNEGKPVSVGLWTVQRGYWSLRGRAEFPQDKQAESRAAIDGFVDAFTALDQPYKSGRP